MGGVSIVAPLTLPDSGQGLGEARLVIHVTVDSSVGVVRLTSISTGSNSSNSGNGSKATHLQGSFHISAEQLGTVHAPEGARSTAQQGTAQQGTAQQDMTQHMTAQQAALGFRCPTAHSIASGQSVGELDQKVRPSS